ncbi:MAG TPA: NifB/NifX family molybdenum-iron cluster-binding protein [Brevefilum fermentans]|jgi:predicted Fe-Mo cluster-binding NifX family protein|uniref:Dinitrogenase iron-molybdenum cofactor biosynthesis protein n=1 Tax=Candidatus Brevifilum fermentans TaxID=1986204 RepID=A0A1Y6K3Z5_9CHLR|nr:NifB/NifX family molybdenum-iron cluster-binding protein [Brevefilum fermentans]MDI9566193.1 NifB/NifX family molybdenum-iron cluster-binding protein [Chloroflexota bacterium]SMX54401.1 Dinitrogenase iron-molybdenum cofactor biosynthesis protein [Brevefilum fermentans]HQA29675.1 NifB/NifX family molybdenum-iron cluster-binding protein [Brevefilum fermentans]
MKIAFITDDGKTISQHFGRASHYLVVEVEDGVIQHQEMREKLGHQQFADHAHQHQHGQGSGMDAASHDKHNRMSQAISDCDVLICGGMGMGAYQSMQSFGITPLVTQIRDIEAAFQAYLSGDLQDETHLLH